MASNAFVAGVITGFMVGAFGGFVACGLLIGQFLGIWSII